MSLLPVYAIEYALEEVQRVQYLYNTDECVYHLKRALECFKEAQKDPFPWDAFIFTCTKHFLDLKNNHVHE